VQVDEADVAHLAVGQAGVLALAAVPWESLRLQVTRITPMAAPRDGRNVFEVEADLLDVPPDLRPGLVGHARIEVGRQPWLVGWLGRAADRLRLLWWRWW
jgi:hypothetical protein